MPCTNRALWRLKCGSWRPCRVGDPDLGWSEEFSFTMPRESYQDGERPRLPGSHHCMVQQYVLQQCAAHSCMFQLTRRRSIRHCLRAAMNSSCAAHSDVSAFAKFLEYIECATTRDVL